MANAVITPNINNGCPSNTLPLLTSTLQAGATREFEDAPDCTIASPAPATSHCPRVQFVHSVQAFTPSVRDADLLGRLNVPSLEMRAFASGAEPITCVRFTELQQGAQLRRCQAAMLQVQRAGRTFAVEHVQPVLASDWTNLPARTAGKYMSCSCNCAFALAVHHP